MGIVYELVNSTGARARSREGRFVADLGQFPRVRIGSPHVAQHDSVHVPSFFEAIDAALARQQSFVVLHDARGLPAIDVLRRVQFFALLERRRAGIHARAAAYAALVSSPFERGVVTSFAWCVKLPLPIRLFQREEDAQAWLNQRLAAFAKSPAVRRQGERPERSG